jgi:hypothetical protein
MSGKKAYLFIGLIMAGAAGTINPFLGTLIADMEQAMSLYAVPGKDAEANREVLRLTIEFAS